MRFRFGRGLTLLRGGNSGTSKIGEDVLYITALKEKVRKMEFDGINGGFAFGFVYDVLFDPTQVFQDVVVSLQQDDNANPEWDT
jgi:hypothetical protein